MCELPFPRGMSLFMMLPYGILKHKLWAEYYAFFIGKIDQQCDIVTAMANCNWQRNWHIGAQLCLPHMLGNTEANTLAFFPGGCGLAWRDTVGPP